MAASNCLAGCLWTLPGSQRDGVHKRFVRSGSEVSFTGEAPEFDLATFQPVEVRRLVPQSTSLLEQHAKDGSAMQKRTSHLTVSICPHYRPGRVFPSCTTAS